MPASRADQSTAQSPRLWAQNAGVKRVGTSVWGRLVTTAQQAEWAFQAESRRMMLEGRGIWKPEHSKPLLELCAGQVFRSVPAHSCLFACTHICMYMYSLVRVPRRRDIFEDVYGPGVQRLCSAPEDNYTCEEWCVWLRKAIHELWAIEDGNLVQVGALACSLVLVHLLIGAF